MGAAADIVQAFMVAWETQDWDTMDSYMADEFLLIGPAPQPLNKRWVIADSKARWAAFPDWKFNVRIVSETGNIVTITTRNTGTHTGMLIPPIPGMAPIAPTGKRFALPEEPAIITLKDGKIVEYKVEPVPGGGYPGILSQIGAEMPPTE